jgi:hypothetical protein
MFNPSRPLRRVRQAIALLALALAIGPTAAASYLIEDFVFEDSESVLGQKLMLNGASTSNILSAKATAVGIYMQQKQTTVDAVLRQPGPKRIRLIALRDISSKDLGTVLMDRIRQNATPDEVATNIMQIVQVGSVFASLQKLAKGDVAHIDWNPQAKATEFRVNGKLIGEAVQGEAFYPMFLKVWLGPRTRAKTRENLLGIGEPLQPVTPLASATQ